MHAQTTARRRGPLTLLAGLATLAIATTGCAEPDRTGTAAGPTGPPDGPGAPVVQIRAGGGVAGPCCPPWDVPVLTAYEDGRVVWVEGTVGQVPGLRQSTVARTGLADLLDQARSDGLFAAGLDAGTLCCDLPEARVTLRSGTDSNEVAIVGLGQEGDGARLTESQRQVRRAVEDLALLLIDRAERSEAYGGYAPEEVAAYVFPTGDEARPATTEWPLERPLTDGGTPVREDGRCLPVTDADGAPDARRVIAAARDADTSIWSSGGRDWIVHLRPMLPHERACTA